MQRSAYDGLRALQSRHWWWRSMANLYSSALRRFLAPGRTYRIIDVGCGYGANLPVLKQFGNVVGIDVSFEALGAIEERPRLGLVQARADALPFRDGSFDVIALLAVVEHIEHDEHVLAESHRVASPQAIQILLTSAFMLLWSHHDEANNHFRRYRARLLDQVQVAAGWHVLVTSYVNSLIFPGVAVIRILQRRMHSKQLTDRDAEYDMGPNISFLETVLRGETWLILGAHTRLPFGVDLFSIARRDD
jgi:ubiquinone/menaquinone biosynthesis C-methylase UbiE